MVHTEIVSTTVRNVLPNGVHVVIQEIPSSEVVAVQLWVRSGFFFSSRRRHTRCSRDWSSDVCSSDLVDGAPNEIRDAEGRIVAARYLLDQIPVAVSAGVEIHPISPEREHTGKRPRNLAQLIEKLRRDIGHPDARACDHLDRPQTPWVTHWKGLQ